MSQGGVLAPAKATTTDARLTTTDARPRGSVVVFVRRRTDTRVGGGHFLIPDPDGILGRGARF